MNHESHPHPALTRAASSRRRFLLSASPLALAAVARPPRPAAAAPVPAEILETKIISQQPEFYHGWPTVARRACGELWVTYSGGRESHVCPFGQIHAMTSRDDGASWTHPRTLLDSATDDRDSGVVETAKGTLLVTTFTSLAYEPYLERRAAFDRLSDKGWTTAPMTPEQLARWTACHRRLDDQGRKADLGEWILRSTDGGASWSTRIPTIVSSPHGPIQLRDGRLLYAGKQLWTADKQIGACESTDDGQTWRWLAGIPSRPGDDPVKGYHELHAAETSDGALVVQIRNHNKLNQGETLQSESTDGGRSWSVPHPIGVWGLPSHLLRLRDGRLLMTYGHRRPPFGNQARLSDDGGKTWGEPISLSADGHGADLGYPSTAELGDGSLITIWYEQLAGPARAALRQARWTIHGKGGPRP